MKLLRSLLLVGVLVGMGTGCATTKQVVPLPDQSRVTADPNKSRIYVLRHTGKIGGAQPATVWDGPEKIGSTGPNGYLCWERDPGDATIRVLWPAAPIPGTFPIKCEKGQTYFIKHGLKMGFWVSRSVLELMPQNEGQELLGKCTRPKLL